MPTYEYLCQTCSHRFETWQKMTEEPLSICPECGGHIRRVLYPAGVIFKGSGFYVNDHKGEHAAAAKSEAKKEEGAADTAKPSSDNSKPAESSASTPKETSSAGDNKASSAA
jgi:putative FmdB family regulatory protein